MSIRAASLVLLAAAGTTALAAPVNYKIDPTHTLPSWEVSHLGFTTQRGRFNSTTGTILLDRAAKSLSVDISIDANSLSTGVEKLDKHLRAEDFFDTAKHPAITFKSTGARFDGDQPATVTGNLTLRGVTRPVTLTVTHFHCGMHPFMKIEVCGADTTTTIKRSDYDIKYALPAVGDEIKLLIPVEGHKQ
jgi:polyisoprenoid-binding protein YceI